MKAAQDRRHHVPHGDDRRDLDEHRGLDGRDERAQPVAERASGRAVADDAREREAWVDRELGMGERVDATFTVGRSVPETNVSVSGC